MYPVVINYLNFSLNFLALFHTPIPQNEVKHTKNFFNLPDEQTNPRNIFVIQKNSILANVDSAKVRSGLLRGWMVLEGADLLHPRSRAFVHEYDRVLFTDKTDGGSSGGQSGFSRSRSSSMSSLERADCSDAVQYIAFMHSFPLKNGK